MTRPAASIYKAGFCTTGAAAWSHAKCSHTYGHPPYEATCACTCHTPEDPTITRQRDIWRRALDAADLARVHAERAHQQWLDACAERDNEAVLLAQMAIEPVQVPR